MSVQKAIEPVIRVTVKTITSFKQIVGAGEIELTIPPESVLQDVISHLVKRFGDRLASRFYKPGIMVGSVERYGVSAPMPLY